MPDGRFSPSDITTILIGAGMSSPRTRSNGLIAKCFDDEVIVIDVNSQRVQALSGPVAGVFRLCSGERSVEEIALELEISVLVVGGALLELERCGLLEDPPTQVDGGWAGVMDRRGLLLAGAMLGVPLIASGVLPVAAAAASTGSPPVLTEQASSTTGLLYPYSVAFSPDFNASTGAGLIAIVDLGNDGRLVVFSYVSGTLLEKASNTTELSSPVSVAFSPDFNALSGAGLIGVGDLGAVVVFSYASGFLTKEANSSTLCAPASVAFSADFKASAGAGLISIADKLNHAVTVFSYVSGTLVEKASTTTGLASPVSAAFSPDFNASSGAGLIGVADLQNGAVVFAYASGSLTEKASTTTGLSNACAVAFSPDFNASSGAGLVGIADSGIGALVVFAYVSGSLTEKASTTTGLSEPRSVAFSPDFITSTGSGLIGIADNGNGAVVVFSYASGALTKKASRTTDVFADPYSVAFSPDFKASSGAGLIGIADDGNGAVEVFTY